jgi:uncharacterized surface protein with fasciclin (FAS1) repeats
VVTGKLKRSDLVNVNSLELLKNSTIFIDCDLDAFEFKKATVMAADIKANTNLKSKGDRRVTRL